MDAKEFVELFYTEKNCTMKQYFDNLQDTEVGIKIDSLGLTKEQFEKVNGIIDTVLTDAMYTILLGLDGECSIGNLQQSYRLYDEKGIKITNG